MMTMYDFDTEYWTATGFVNAQYDAWRYKSDNNKYVKPDSTVTTRGSYVIVYAEPEHPVIHGNGVVQANDDLKYIGKIRLYNNTVNTTPPIAIPGATYGQYSCVIPTAEEWNAMTTEEKNTFKNTYFEYETETALTKTGVSIGTFYDVKAYIYAICKGGDYPTDANYPYYSTWGDTTTAVYLYYDADSNTPTYVDYNVILAQLFIPEEEGVFKALVIQTEQQEFTRYWTGYSGNTATYKKSANRGDAEPSGAVVYDVRSYEWSIDATTNNGYPYRIDMTDFSFDLIVDPIPSFFWRMNNNVNQGYPYLVEKDLPVLGAFGDNKNLRTVVVPRSVSYIGDYGFANTKLSAVTISEDCEYNENTSFPTRCVINYYT